MTDTTQDLIARLNRTLTTMMNDCMPFSGTEKRTRHIERTVAVLDAADWIEAAIARESSVRDALSAFEATLHGYDANRLVVLAKSIGIDIEVNP